MQEKYGDAFEILFQKKFWPHIDGTGGFFVAKIRKIRTLNQGKIPNDIQEESERDWKISDTKKVSNSNKELKLFRGNITPWNIQEHTLLYEHSGKILAVSNSEV